MQNTRQYDFMCRKLRKFFHAKGFIEVPAFSRLSIMAACEDPTTITEYTLGGVRYPLPQTGQMWLEMDLLKNPDWPGVFCLGPSYRDEPNPIAGRHVRLFPMFDFEGKGSFEDLKKIESELLVYLGFQAPTSLDYNDVCASYETPLIEAEHEDLMCKQVSPVISLEKFPWRANPYWNMKHIGNNIFNKIDIILYGMETIGSAERSCNVKEMQEYFFANSEGKYADLLFSRFGKDRVLKELEDYFAFDYFPRFGGGIGLMRLEAAMVKAGLFADITIPVQTQPKYQEVSA